jgi:hypothetical protein
VFTQLLLFSAAVSALPDIVVAPGPRGFIARVATFDARQQVAVDAEIDRRAAAMCKGSQVRWGQFSSTATLGKQPGTERVPMRGYTREFSCVLPQTASYAPAPADWKPSAADFSDALAVFNGYYAKRDSGDFAGAMRLFAPDMLGDPPNWSAEMSATNKKLGAGTRRVTGVSWYVNPDGAPHPGVYVAIDFIGEFPQAYFYCGYVALYRRGAGSYEITREEQNMFTHGDGTVDQSQIDQMRAGMCRGQ